MNYTIGKIKIIDLISLYLEDHLDLQPPYQRNPVWDKKTKQLLLDSIINNYPLPSIFLFQKDAGNYEMVDGQQRTRTILGFYRKDLLDKNGRTFDDINKEQFLNYEIPLVTITGVEIDEKIESYYARVNSSGKRLNRPELLKAKYFSTNFLSLAEELTEFAPYEDLNLFSESSHNRMNDLDFTAELIGLIKLGRTDKKDKIDDIFQSDLSPEECDGIRNMFLYVLSHFERFNSIYPIGRTRYKQRNDFYTLFDFVLCNRDKPNNLLDHIYRTLVLIDDAIAPSNEECEPLQLYAFNCVSQSNSKNARDLRFNILTKLFLNRYDELTDELMKVLDFYGLSHEDIINCEEHTMIDLEALEEAAK